MPDRIYISITDDVGRVVGAVSCSEKNLPAQTTPPGRWMIGISRTEFLEIARGGGKTMREKRGKGRNALEPKGFFAWIVTGRTVRAVKGRPHVYAAEAGDRVVIRHNAAGPIKLWLDHEPLVGPSLGSYGPDDAYALTVADVGMRRIHCTSDDVYCEDLYLNVLPKLGS